MPLWWYGYLAQHCILCVEDFGFEHMLWVYSGRRGVHCWVADPRARVMENTARKAIVSYLEIIKGGSEMNRKVKLPYVLHPSLQYVQ